MSITRDVLVSVNSILIGANAVQLVMLDEAMAKAVVAIVACVQVVAIWCLMKEGSHDARRGLAISPSRPSHPPLVMVGGLAHRDRRMHGNSRRCRRVGALPRHAVRPPCGRLGGGIG